MSAGRDAFGGLAMVITGEGVLSKSTDDVVRELREGAGIRFDPDLAARVVDVLLSTEEKQTAD